VPREALKRRGNAHPPRRRPVRQDSFFEKLSGKVDRGVLVFFWRWVSEEPGLLLSDELRGLIVEIANGFEGEPTGDVVGLVVGRGFQVGGPALGGFNQLGQGFANVAVTGAVVVQIVVELVGDGSELLEEIVGVLLAAGLTRSGEEILYGFVAGIEKLDENKNAVVGIVGDLSELLYFAVGKGGVGTLGGNGRSKREQKKDEQESAEHRFLVFWFLVFEDLS
jgi:hypothetical protein